VEKKLQDRDISTIKLILYRDGIEVKAIVEKNTKEGSKRIFEKIDEWKAEDVKRNTVKFIIENEK